MVAEGSYVSYFKREKKEFKLVQTTMVRITKQRLDGINKRIREIVEGSKEFIECVKHGNALENAEDTAAVLKLKLERNLEKLKGIIKEIDDLEIEKVLEDYEESQFNGEDMLTELEVFIVKCKDKRQIELNERKQRMEMEQKEKTNGNRISRKRKANGARSPGHRKADSGENTVRKG